MSMTATIYTPRKHHLAGEHGSVPGSAYTTARTVCGKFLFVGHSAYTPNKVVDVPTSDLREVVTCKNCLRTIAPSKVVFADESTAVVGPGQTVAPVEAQVVPASPTVELRWNPAGVWEVHVNFSDPASEPEYFVNGMEAEVYV